MYCCNICINAYTWKNLSQATSDIDTFFISLHFFYTLIFINWSHFSHNTIIKCHKAFRQIKCQKAVDYIIQIWSTYEKKQLSLVPPIPNKWNIYIINKLDILSWCLVCHTCRRRKAANDFQVDITNFVPLQTWRVCQHCYNVQTIILVPRLQILWNHTAILFWTAKERLIIPIVFRIPCARLKQDNSRQATMAIEQKPTL